MSIIYNVTKLEKSYGNKPILNISHLAINQGEIIGLVGSNGSGKSTLLRHLASLETQDSGKIFYKGSQFCDVPIEQKREIAILLPEPYLLKRTVKENLLFGLAIQGEKQNLDKRLNEALELVGLLPKKFINRYWYELSSGETQRIALASRLILRPKTLLLDEPTNSLDISGIPAFSEAITYANREWGSTIVVASHDLNWLSSITTRKIGLHFGRVMEFSTTNLILGKWEKTGDKLLYKLSDSEFIALPNSWNIGEKRGIAINPKLITRLPKKIVFQDNFTNCLEGVVKEITHLPTTQEIAIKVQIGSHLIELIEQYCMFEQQPLYPSQKTFISFTLDAIKIPK